MNAYQYVPNPTGWIDPLGLRPKKKREACAAACSGPPCSNGRRPGLGAAAFQSGKEYPNKDNWSNDTLPKGTTIYTLYPYGPKGPGGFFADESTLAASKKSVTAYHEATQVGHSGNSRNFVRPARQKVQEFTLTKDLCVGESHALANDQYGPGGGLQYYISKKDRRSLKAGSIIQMTNP